MSIQQATPRKPWSPLDRFFRLREERLKELYGPRGEMPERVPRRLPQFTLRRLLIAVGLFALSLSLILQAPSFETLGIYMVLVSGAAFGGGLGILAGRFWLGTCIGFGLSAAAVAWLVWVLSGLTCCCG